MELERAQKIADELKRLLPRIESRFWLKVLKTDDENGCWLWTGAKNSDGYGNIKVGQHGIGAHRVAYLVQVGDIPLGIAVLHSCDNPTCVRGSHLFLGSQIDNMQDMLNKGRGNKAQGDNNGSRLYPERRPRGASHCFHMHPDLHARGEKVAQAKLTANQVIEIRAQWSGGVSQHSLARKFQVSLSNIHQIVSGKTWRHLYEGEIPPGAS